MMMLDVGCFRFYAAEDLCTLARNVDSDVNFSVVACLRKIDALGFHMLFSWYF